MSLPEYRSVKLSQELLKGAIDIHMHCMPDTVQRRMDEIELAEMARDYGMRALLLKIKKITGEIVKNS